MSASKTEQRKFNVTDAEMIQASRVFQQLFVTDKENFTALDTDFIDPYADDWLAKIDEAAAVAKDVLLKDTLAAKTELVAAALDNCRKHYMKMKYFIEKAFPGQKAIWNEFGYNDYNKARNSEVKMLQFMLMLHAASLKYGRELNNAGYLSEDIPVIEQLYQELLMADNAQEIFKKERVLLTAERIGVLNDCWDYTLKVNKASKTVFADNPAKLSSYVLKSSSAPEPEEAAV